MRRVLLVAIALGLPILVLSLLDGKEGAPKYFWLDARTDIGGRWTTGTLFEFQAERRPGPGRGIDVVYTDDHGESSSRNMMWVNYFTVPWQAGIPWSCAPPEDFLISLASRFFRWFASTIGDSMAGALTFSVAVLLIVALASAGRPDGALRCLFFVFALLAIFGGVSTFLAADNHCVQVCELVRSRTTASGRILPLPAEEIRSVMGSRSFLPWTVGFFLGFQILLLRECVYAIRGAHYLLVPHPAERYVRRRPGKPSEIDVEGFEASLGRENATKPPPDFVIKNKARRIRNLADLFRAEREAAEEAVRQQRATRPESKK